MKFATKPSRSSDATSSMPPTRTLSVAVAPNRVAGSALGATAPSSAAVRMAIVVVVLTLRGRDVPSSA